MSTSVILKESNTTLPCLECILEIVVGVSVLSAILREPPGVWWVV